MTRYDYQVLVTNLPMKPQNIWYFYRGRAAIELIIKELKDHYTLANIPTNNFQANQAYFYLFAYNLVNWLEENLSTAEIPERYFANYPYRTLVLPARLVKSYQRNVLRIPAEYISQQALEQIMHKIEEIKEL